jgi:NADPH2:quinone reductase
MATTFFMGNIKMKAIQIQQAGSYDVLEYVEIETPIPAPGQVLIKVESISVNFADTMVRRGIYAPMPKLPAILGMECSGIVETLGEGVSHFFQDQPVAFMGPNCYAKYVVVDAGSLIPLPDSIDMDEAAAFPINYLTAYHILHTMARVQPEEIILCYAAAGGVGIAAAQLSKLANVTTIGLTSTDEKADFAKNQGYDFVINYKTENTVKRVREITDGKGVNVILNSVAGKSFGIDFKLLAPLGQIIWFGFAGGAVETDLTRRLSVAYNQSLGIRTFYLHSVPRIILLKSIGILLDYLAKKKIQPFIYEIIPLSEAAIAHQLIESGSTMGKIVLKP